MTWTKWKAFFIHVCISYEVQVLFRGRIFCVGKWYLHEGMEVSQSDWIYSFNERKLVSILVQEKMEGAFDIFYW